MRSINLMTVLTLALATIPFTYTTPSASALKTSTWSIVAADPATGDVGVAAASCVPLTHIDAVAALAPGKGAAATQSFWQLENRNTVFQRLQEGQSAEEIIQHVSDPANDAEVGTRQYGIVTILDGQVEIATFTGEDNFPWAGALHDTNMVVSVQGNILVGETVVEQALQAFQANLEQGRNTLPDRLMRSLVAGSLAGGDSRCNSDDIVQTAATAFILVARGTDPPYATRDIGLTDMDTPQAPWLALSVTEPHLGANPLIELQALYDTWRQNNLEQETLIEPTTWGSTKQSQGVQ